jgi:hypothetical protein
MKTVTGETWDVEGKLPQVGVTETTAGPALVEGGIPEKRHGPALWP